MITIKHNILIFQIFVLTLPIYLTHGYIETGNNYFKDEEKTYPCNHFDTVNITSGTRNPDGSITHDNITYASHHYKIFDYIYKNHTEKIQTEPHIRGCICKYRICMRGCCPRGYIFNGGCFYDDDFVMNDFNVTIREGVRESVHDLYSDSKFGLTFIKTCSGYELEPDITPDDKWSLEFKDDHIMLQGYELTLKNTHYCLAYNNESTLVTIVCVEDADNEKYKLIPLGIYFENILLYNIHYIIY